ncbi:proteasome 26S regulatory subunit, partial [Cardiosporidium cionae]
MPLQAPSHMNGKDETHKPAASKRKKSKELEDLSEEDRRIKEELDLLVEVVKGNDKELMSTALTTLFKEVSTATSSVTSVPKPLKLLRPHYDSLVQVYETVLPSDSKRVFADVLSILSTTYSKDDSRRMLRYRLEGTPNGFTLCGHEYTKNLSGEIAAEFATRSGENKPTEDLLSLVEEIIPFYMKHNAECEAVDLLCEVDEIERIVEYVDETSFNRVVLYIQSMSNYADSDDDKSRMLKVAYTILMKHKRYPDALRVAMKQKDVTFAEAIVKACDDPLILKQLALMCSRQRMAIDFSIDEELVKIAAGELVSSQFQYLAKELDVLEPKLPEDVFKTHLEER